MTGYVYCLCILCTLLSGVRASLIVHKRPLSWKDALKSCVHNKQTLFHGIDEHLMQQLRWCMNEEDLTFWTGGYTTNAWISFRGCFDFNNQSMYILNKSQSHTVSSCHQFCGRPVFGITINTCVCLKSNILRQHQTLIKRHNCILSGGDYIGINRTIAIYKLVVKMSVISQRTPNSSCSVYMCNSSQYKFYGRKCSGNAQVKCDNDLTAYQTVTWDEALSVCLQKGSYLTGPLPNSICQSHSNNKYWSYVRRYREHKYVTRDSTWGSKIVECEITNLNGGSITLERTRNCKSKPLPYICQSGVHASLIVHKNPLSWKAALRSCVQKKQTLFHGIDEHLTQELRWCMNGEDLTFWTGGYTTNAWISCRGCFDFNNQSMYILNKSQSHTVSSCHQFRGRHMFGISINTCVCLKSNIFRQHQTLIKRHNCILTGEDNYIGINRTIAIYKHVGKQSGISQQTTNSSCSVYMCNGSRYKFYSRRCSGNAQYKCDNWHISRRPLIWNEAVRTCLSNGGYLSWPFPNSKCGTRSNIGYWSYVRRFPEHKYVCNKSSGSNIEECEIAHLNGGSNTLELTSDCNRQLLSYICQSDDGSRNIHVDSEQCNFQNYTTKVSYPSKSISLIHSAQLSSTNSGQNERQTTSYQETTTTPDGNNNNISDTGIQCASKGHETGATHSGEEIVHTTNHFTQDSSTHSVRNMMASKKESRVGLIGGVAAACVVAVLSVVVISVFCRRRSKKNKHKERKNVSSSKEIYHPRPDVKQAVEQGEINMNEISICDVELYDMSGEAEYDHLRSNNRRVKKEAESMYDTTARVKAEEEMYSSTRKRNSDVESSDFYDSMQRIKNEDENIYDHSITDSTYSQTAAPRFAMAEY